MTVYENVAFALRVRKCIRNIDLACRYGGEEFVLVMPETDIAVATMVAERLRRRWRHPRPRRRRRGGTRTPRRRR